MIDVFPDLPDHPDYLPLITEVSQHLGVTPKLCIPRPVRMTGLRKSRQAWTWAWLEQPEVDATEEPIIPLRREFNIIIDINDPWHGQPFYNYEIKINDSNGLYITLQSRNRPPVTVAELRKALLIHGALPLVRAFTRAPEDGAEFSW